MLAIQKPSENRPHARREACDKLRSILREPRKEKAQDFLPSWIKIKCPQINDLLCLFRERNNEGLYFKTIADEFGLSYCTKGHSTLTTLFQRLSTKHGFAVYTRRFPFAPPRHKIKYYIDNYTADLLKIAKTPGLGDNMNMTDGGGAAKLTAGSKRGLQLSRHKTPVVITENDASNYPEKRMPASLKPAEKAEWRLKNTTAAAILKLKEIPVTLNQPIEVEEEEPVFSLDAVIKDSLYFDFETAEKAFCQEYSSVFSFKDVEI